MKNNKYLVFMGIGFELVGALLAGIYSAQYLEKKFETKGMLTLAILFLVLAGWLVHIVYLLKKIQKKDENSQ